MKLLALLDEKIQLLIAALQEERARRVKLEGALQESTATSPRSCVSGKTQADKDVAKAAIDDLIKSIDSLVEDKESGL